MSWRDRLRAALNAPSTTSERTTGKPTSSNGASSLHLNWSPVPPNVHAVSIDLTIVEPPTTNDLYFWAMQASFTSGNHSHGAGHIGLQHISGYPNNAAVNWGGYHDGGGELAGTESPLPSSRGNVNTRDYHWRAGTSYRLEIAKIGADDLGHQPAASTDSSWRGSVIDLASNERTLIRELKCPGTELRHIVMWSEVFAACDAPPVSVRWSNPTAYVGATNSETWTPGRMHISYQRVEDGGCSNTVSMRDPEHQAALIQRTNSARSNRRGDVI